MTPPRFAAELPKAAALSMARNPKISRANDDSGGSGKSDSPMLSMSPPAAHATLDAHSQGVANTPLPQGPMPVAHQDAASVYQSHSEAQARTAASSPSETFSALDATHVMPGSTWTHTGARHAEAGYLDPSLGWVGVRAENTGAAVHASILAGSAEAAGALDTHLAGLNSFVAVHHGSGSTVTIASPDQHAFGGSLSQSGEGSARQQAGERFAGAEKAAHPANTGASSDRRSEPHFHSHAPASWPGAGVHISVVA
jgi:hypothetical protein